MVIFHLTVFKRTTYGLIISGIFYFEVISLTKISIEKKSQTRKMLSVLITHDLIAFSPRDRPIIFPLELFFLWNILLMKNYFRYVEVLFHK